jgi:hypothetical protein
MFLKEKEEYIQDLKKDLENNFSLGKIDFPSGKINLFFIN